MRSDVIHVGCQADHRFAPDCAVMLRSLLAADPSEAFEIHFLHDPGLPATDLEGLRSVVADLGAGWHPIPVTAEDLRGFPSIPRYGGLTAWYRLLLPRLMADQRRVLYLDADLMVIEPVRALWEHDLGDHLLAAVTNPTLGSDRQRVITDLGLDSPEQYFNSGLMLLDLERLRVSGRMDEVERFVRERNAPMPWADQEPLNAVLARDRMSLHPRWNVMNPCYELPARLLPWTEDEVADAIARPAIVHFIGPRKAWHRGLSHPHKHTWHRHLAATPFADRPMEGTLRDRAAALVPPRTRSWAVRTFAVDRRAVAHSARSWANDVLSPRHLAGLRRTRAALRSHGPRPADELAWLLQTFADTTDDVCFVQIGSNDATHGDPLRELSTRRGWHGLLVEPIPHVFERLVSATAGHPNLRPVNVAIGPIDGEQDFFAVEPSDDPALPEWYDQIGSFSLENVLHPYHVEQIPDLADRVLRTKVQCLTFATFWERHRLPRLDLLHIDAEGYDAAILRQVDLELTAPTMLLYEHKHLEPEDASELRQRLDTFGYASVEVGPDTVAIHGRTAPASLRRVLRRIDLQHRKG